MSRLRLVVALLVACMPAVATEPFLEAELLFPLEHWHNHSSSIVETPGGGLFVVWFHGSGEHTADDGQWLLVYNDLERGRNSLAVSLSDDEGTSWKWTRHLERDDRPTDPAMFHYPSVIQGRDGSIHVTYSYFLEHVPRDSPRKSIKHAMFNVEWVVDGD